jgi:diacylglycerol kinase (ATP)
MINISKLLKSFSFAFRGIAETFQSEQNFRFHLFCIPPVVVLGIYLSLSMLEWGIIILSIFLVLAAELFNTALEKLSDKAVSGRTDRIIKSVKDISAGAVFIAALNALIIAVLFLFYPLAVKIIHIFK